jgi:hypothetical protein
MYANNPMGPSKVMIDRQSEQVVAWAAELWHSRNCKSANHGDTILKVEEILAMAAKNPRGFG